MPWKMNAEGQMVVDGGNPVWVNDDGKEGPVQGNAITRLNAENKTLREKVTANEAAITAFGDLDPVAAKDAMEKLKGVDLSKMVPNDQLEALKTQLNGQFTKAIAEKDALIATKDKRLEEGAISRAFAASQFIRDRLTIGSDFAEAYFRKHVKYDEATDTVTVNGANGQPIAAPGSFGDNATFDQALEVLVTARADKEKLLKAVTPGGMGSGPNAGRNAAGILQVTREALQGLNPAQIKDTMDKVKKGEAVIVD
jgi:hypothetical protein